MTHFLLIRRNKRNPHAIHGGNELILAAGPAANAAGQ
jgi:hypothetical protein